MINAYVRREEERVILPRRLKEKGRENAGEPKRLSVGAERVSQVSTEIDCRRSVARLKFGDEAGRDDTRRALVELPQKGRREEMRNSRRKSIPQQLVRIQPAERKVCEKAGKK